MKCWIVVCNGNLASGEVVDRLWSWCCVIESRGLIFCCWNVHAWLQVMAGGWGLFQHTSGRLLLNWSVLHLHTCCVHIAEVRFNHLAFEKKILRSVLGKLFLCLSSILFLNYDSLIDFWLNLQSHIIRISVSQAQTWKLCQFCHLIVQKKCIYQNVDRKNSSVWCRVQ